ncbi:MAG: 5'-nucleotidase C-terminal domain-containing protein [Bacillota bacterium]|nr:5'-nucleotidase C-terminal domain-containing protein [Bacillota bacterium]
MQLKILHTNDVHSNFDNFSKIASIINKVRDENTLILDAGDFTDFKNIALQGTKGQAGTDLLSIAGYDAASIGNNETFALLPTLEYMASNSRVPYISSNLTKKDGSKINGVNSSIILEKAGLKILLIGLSPDLGPFNPLLGFHLKNSKEAIKEELNENKGKYDLVILIDHIGTERDFNIAQEIPDIDIIISSHDHKLFQKAKIVNKTIINSAGEYGEHLGYMIVDYNGSGLSLLDSGVISSGDEQENQHVLASLKENNIIARKNLSSPLYFIDKSLTHDNIEENPICNLIADGLRDFLKCDIGLINGGICNGGIKKGPVTDLKLIEICPSPLNPTSFNIKGKYLRQALEESLDGSNCLKEGRGPGFRGRFVGKLHLSGGEIYCSDDKIDKILINGYPLEDEKLYSVASSDYLQRGSGYESLSKNQDTAYRAEYLRDIIRIYADKKEFIDNSFIERWVKS